MKRDRKKVNHSLFDNHSVAAIADPRKIGISGDGLAASLNNYLYFQRFNSFHWPLWLSYSLDEFVRHFHPAAPFCLGNTINRDTLRFSNFLSPEHLLIDPCGMISPCFTKWSVELWMIVNNTLYRPQRHSDSIVQTRDERSSLIQTAWNNGFFHLSSEVYGTRTSIDEAIVDIRCASSSRGGSGTILMVTIRPYNHQTIGGISSLEYREAGKTVRINKKDTVYFSKNPRDVFTGSGTQGDLGFREKQEKSNCSFGMATMALAYPVKKEGIELKLRFSLSSGKPVDALKLNYQNIKKDFTDYCTLMKGKGFNISVADEKYSRWFSAAKLNSLGMVNRIIAQLNAGDDDADVNRIAYYLVMALSRMGYDGETRMIIESWHRSVRIPESPGFHDLVKFCYFIAAFSDYFTIARDTEFLQSHYDKLRSVAAHLINSGHIVTQQKKAIPRENSIPCIFTATGHIHDTMLYAHALAQYAYLCRTIGLFGDEIRFNKESQKTHESIVHKLMELTSVHAKQADAVNEADAAPGTREDEFTAYAAFGIFPFTVEGLKAKEQRKILDMIVESYGKFPLFIRSMGAWDMFLTVMLANILLLKKDPRSLEILELAQNLGGRKYSMADFINPVTLRGTGGDGDSSLVTAGIFLFLRNIVLVDSPSRLELFPIPREEWFKPGAELNVENAPTRFGKINFKLVSTQNEVQIFFDELPKFIPPDIMINLPYKTIIKEGDDFVLKKEEGNSFIINGWPSIIRFGRT